MTLQLFLEIFSTLVPFILLFIYLALVVSYLNSYNKIKEEDRRFAENIGKLSEKYRKKNDELNFKIIQTLKEISENTIK